MRPYPLQPLSPGVVNYKDLCCGEPSFFDFLQPEIQKQPDNQHEVWALNLTMTMFSYCGVIENPVTHEHVVHTEK